MTPDMGVVGQIAVIRGDKPQRVCTRTMPDSQFRIICPHRARADHDRVTSGAFRVKPLLQKHAITGKQRLA